MHEPFGEPTGTAPGAPCSGSADVDPVRDAMNGRRKLGRVHGDRPISPTDERLVG